MSGNQKASCGKRDLHIHNDLTPFYLEWSFGRNLLIRVLNLTAKSRSLIFYSASHVGILYDYVSNETKTLEGHKNALSSISSDDSGRWLVTADGGKNNLLIVWDSCTCIPVRTIPNSHPNCGSALAAISGNAKYLVTLGKDLELQFWLWTYENETPNGTYKITGNYGSPIKICFNPNVQEHLIIAFEKQLFFIQWVDGKLSNPLFPIAKNFRKVGHITDCCYIDKCHECVACTTEGIILVYGSTYYTRNYEEAQLENDKLFVKAIKISKSSLLCISSTDGLVVTGDVEGHLKFYDKTIKIIFWCQSFNLLPITSISFNLEERQYHIKDVLDFEEEDHTSFEFGDDSYEDRSESFEQLYSQLVPLDATLERQPFIVRDFVAGTKDGQIALVDPVLNNCDLIFKECESPITAISIHDEEPYLCVAYQSGIIRLYNYNTFGLVAQNCIPDELNPRTDIETAIVTCLSYSPLSLQLACGKNNGSLWFLQPISLTPVYDNPITYVRDKIIKLTFSKDCRFFAYYNENATIVILKYVSNEWEILGKLRSHYKPITDMMFTPYSPFRLFTIGEDRHLIEYDLQNSCNGKIIIISSERIEQTAVPLCFIYCPRPKPSASSPSYFLIFDNQFKYKKVQDRTFMCHSVMLGPAYGCYENSPVKKMRIVPKSDERYLLFANDNYIGIQLMFPDGNPYKQVGLIGHPKKLLDFLICKDGKFLFTIGEDDNCVLMWKINLLSVHELLKLGGVELQPYYSLIEGGIHGWLFKEMQDLFYYMQILHQGENTVLPRVVSDQIPVSELPDLMRACGFYPSEYEIENMITDIKYRNFDETNILKEHVSFIEFVQLYLNYRPACGISIEKLKSSFETFSFAGEGPRSSTMTSSSFVAAICEKGEIFSYTKAHTCLATLMHEEEAEDEDATKDFSFLPQTIDFDVFIEDILGIDMNRQAIDEGDHHSN